MGKRATGRRLALQILYQIDCCEADLIDAADAAFANTNYIESTRCFALERAQAVIAKVAELDLIIAQKAKGWRLDRLSIIDKSILRLSLYEYLYDPEVPKEVAINEAVELAKKYSEPAAARFINGIMGAL